MKSHRIRIFGTLVLTILTLPVSQLPSICMGEETHKRSGSHIAVANAQSSTNRQAIDSLFTIRHSELTFETPVAITNVTIVTQADERITAGTILIVNGRISALGERVTIPRDAQIIDGKDLIAYPGFIDASTFLGISKEARTKDERLRVEDVNPDPVQGPLAITREANRRGIRPEFRSLENYAPKKDKLKAHRAAGFTTALVTPREEILSGTSDLVALSDVPVRRAALATKVGLHASFRATEEGDYPRTLLGTYAQFRQVMLDARWYAKMQKYAQRHPLRARRAPSDAALDALQPLLARRQRIFFEANSEREIRRAIKLADEHKLDLVITGAREAWKVSTLIKDRRIPLIVSLKFDDEPEYGKKKKSKKGKEKAKDKTDKVSKDKKDTKKKIYEPLKVRKERRRLWHEQVDNLIRLAEADIPFALRTGDLEKPGEFWKNLRKVTKRGLSESAVVAALTNHPAEFFGLAHQLGAILPGQLANLTLMDKILTDDKAKVKMVFIDGEKFEIKDEKSKSKGRKDDADKKNHDDSSDQESAIDEEPAPSNDSDDKGPTFATEILADRRPATQTGGDVLIENATIIPVTAPTLINASILIRHGKIEAIGTIHTVPSGVTRIDGTGRFIIPGLVDAHSHLGLDGVNEWPQAISAEVRIEDLLNTDSVGLFRAAAGGATTHHTMHGSSNPIGGQNAIWKIKYRQPVEDVMIPDAPPTIKFALGENVTHSNRQSSLGKRYPNTRMGVEALMRTAFEHTKQYQQAWKDYDRLLQDGLDAPPPRVDLRLEALSDILDGQLTVHTHCYRSDEILRLLQMAEDYGFRIGTLQHVLEGYRIAPEIARHGSGASTFSNFWAYKIEAYGAIPQNAALMTEYGINVSINSDSANTIRYLAQEAAKCIKWGNLNENQALRLVTINPAMQLQIDHRIGSLEVGKDGDLAIFNGHPLNTFSKCIMTLIDGEVYFEDARPEPTERCDTVNLPRATERPIPDTRHRAYAITGATIHTISGPVINNGIVVVVEDRIQSVGSVGAMGAMGENITIPPGASVIDATGLHVYPGLIDAGSTLGLTEIGAAKPTRDNREIATFSPNLHSFSAVHPHSEHIRIARSGGITTALTKPSGGNISGQSAVIHLDGWSAPEMLVLNDVGLHMSVPSLPVHLRGDKKRKEKAKKDHKLAVQKLEDFMTKAKHYAKVLESSTRSDAAGGVDLKLQAMLPYVRGDKPVIFTAHSYKHILDTIEFAEKHKLKMILSGATRSWKLADTLADKNIPVILGTPLSYPRGEFEPWDSIYRCAGVLHRAGVKFCFASESASGAYNLGIQAGMAVAHGLPKEAAERALTLSAAEILGLSDRVGSIEPGKIADLIVTTDTPLQTVSQVTHMFIAGRPVSLSSMHTESYGKFKNRPTPNLPPLPDLVGPPSLTGR